MNSIFSPETNGKLLLGSQSPRRHDLLKLLVPEAIIRVQPPFSAEELEFAGLNSTQTIVDRAALIARDKLHAVQQENATSSSWEHVLTADTVVIAENLDGSQIALGKPDLNCWKTQVQQWFETHYSGRSHAVVTAVCIGNRTEIVAEYQVTTIVTFRHVSSQMLQWYLRTEESLGKAGGYGIQGAADLFIESIQGSPSNVMGLPLESTWQALRELNLLNSIDQ